MLLDVGDHVIVSGSKANQTKELRPSVYHPQTHQQVLLLLRPPQPLPEPPHRPRRPLLQPTNPNPSQPKPTTKPFNIKNWDPHFLSNPNSNPSPSTLSSASLRLSPIARFIVDAFRRNDNKWCPNVTAELSKLRRITPNLVAEVLKVQTNHTLASKFFHWAGSQRGFHHNFASYNALAYCLNRHHQFRVADQLPELMESQGKPPSEKQFEILIRMHSDANRGLRVYHVYEKMRNKFGVKPRVFLYNRVMDALVRTGHLDLALSVYDDLKEDGLVEESVTFMVLVKGLCKCGRIDEMLEVLGRMRERLCKPDVFAYTALVKILVPAGNLDACLRVWEEMKRDRVVPDVKAYATMIVGLAKGGRVQEGYELFREMKGKGCLVDRVIYGALVEAFVAEGKVGLAFDLLKDLVSSGYRADLGIYICLIEGLCNLNRVQKAYKLFQLTVREGLEPDFLTVKPLLVAYAEANRMEEFCKLLEQMQKLGFPVIADLSKFFSVLVEKKGPIMALETFGQLKEKGHVSVEIYNIFMDSLHKIGEVKKALSLFDEMKGLSLKPDSFTYCTAILCLVDLGEIKEACACHNRIIEMSCIPSVAAYSSLTKGLCQIGEIDEAMLLVHDCLGNVSDGPLEFKYSLTIIHACKSNVAEKVIDVLNEMIEQGCSIDNVIYCSIISGMCKHGTIEEARKVFSNLRERNFLTESNTIVYDELLIDHMKKKTADLIVHATLDNYEWSRQNEEADVRAEAHHNWVDEVIRCEGRGGSVIGNDNRSSCLIIQPRPEIKGPSLLTREEIEKPEIWAQICIQRMVELAKESTTMRRVLDPIFVYFDSRQHWAPQKGLAMIILSRMAYFMENSGNQRLILASVIHHLDHKNVMNDPQLKTCVIQVATSLAMQIRSESGLEEIGFVGVLCRHLRKSLQAYSEFVGEQELNLNISLQNSIDDCLLEIANGVIDAQPLFDLMAINLENIPSGVVGRATIESLIILARAVTLALSHLHSQQDESPSERKITKLCEYAAKNPFRIPKMDATYTHNIEKLVPKVCMLSREHGEACEKRCLRASSLQCLSAMIVRATLDNYEWSRQNEEADVRAEAHHNWVDEVIRCEGRGGSVIGNDNRSSCLIIQPRPEIKGPSLLTGEEIEKPEIWAQICIQRKVELAKESTTMRRVLDPMFVYFDSRQHWAPQKGLAMIILSRMAYFMENSGNQRLILASVIHHLDHKNVMNDPQLKTCVIQVATSLAMQIRSESGLAEIGFVGVLCRHLRKSLQASSEFGGEQELNLNISLKNSIDDCLL
ncbi:Pentatricopeptide repeat-containing protein [Glycine max]|nr:Pentatricopeptide repeat-containing protein [Glycine max]